MLKLMEKITDNYIRAEFLIELPLHIHQYAYQTGKSTETALHTVTRCWSILNERVIYAPLPEEDRTPCWFARFETLLKRRAHFELIPFGIRTEPARFTMKMPLKGTENS